jgi:hypothetical protein
MRGEGGILNNVLHARHDGTLLFFLCYLLQPVWTKRGMAIRNLSSHVPSAMFNNVDGGKEEMSTM